MDKRIDAVVIKNKRENIDKFDTKMNDLYKMIQII